MRLTFEEFLSLEALKFENCKDLLLLIQTEYNNLKTKELSSLEVLDLIFIIANDTLSKVLALGFSVNSRQPENFEAFKVLNKEQVRFLLQLIRSIKNSIHDEEIRNNS